jgi:hypothetical protein
MLGSEHVFVRLLASRKVYTCLPHHRSAVKEGRGAWRAAVNDLIGIKPEG